MSEYYPCSPHYLVPLYLERTRLCEKGKGHEIGMCRLDKRVEKGCILLDHVQQHNLHLASLEKYEFRYPIIRPDFMQINACTLFIDALSVSVSVCN